MRVDNSPPAAPGYPAGFTYPTDYNTDHLSQAKRYLKAIKRRWPVIVVFVLLGTLVGWATTPGETESGPLGPRTQYYQATHTLIGPSNVVPGDETSSSGTIDLTQAAFLATAGDVPQRVAERLGIPVERVENYVLATPRGDVNSIEITSVGTDSTTVTQLADTTAAELVSYLNERAQASYDAALGEALADLDEYRRQREEIQAKIAAGDGNPDELDAELQSVLNRYTAAYQRFSSLSEVRDPSPGLSTLETAKAFQITEQAHMQLRQRISMGPDYTPPTTEEGSTSTSSVETAEPPDPKVRAAMGGLLGLFAAIGLILGLDRFDPRLRRRDDVEAVTGLPVLAEIPPMTRTQQSAIEVVASTSPRSRAAEAYRVVRSAILFTATADAAAADAATSGNGNGTERRVKLKPSLSKGDPVLDSIEIGPQTILVTSPGPNEGKTTTVANLAAVLAEGGLSVLVINCDFRRPRVHKYLVHEGANIEGDEMAATVAAGALSGQVKAMRTEIPKVRLITGIGENDPNANPLEIVALQRKIVHAARGHFDVVLLDTAPILTTNDASELLPECDHVIMVVRNGKTKREAAQRTAEILTRFEAPVLGVVFNGSDDTPAVQYYYNYYLDSTGKRVRGAAYLTDEVLAASAAPPTGPGAPTSA